MAYLIIPILCFVLLAGVAWVLNPTPPVERVSRGKLDDLDVVLSVLMTANWDETYLVLKVPRRVTSLKMTFPGTVVRLEMPLVTRIQRSRRENYLAVLREFNLQPRISGHVNDHEILEWVVESPPSKASEIIAAVFARLFDVDPGISVEFRVCANPMDQNVINQGLTRKQSGGEIELATAATQGHQVESSAESRAGCLKPLAVVLLFPVPFMAAHLQLGYIAASAVLVGLVVVPTIYGLWRGSKKRFRPVDTWRITALLLAGSTIYFSDPVYLQLMPTAVLAVVAIAEVIAVTFNLPELSAFDARDRQVSRAVRLLFTFAILTVAAGGIATNEYLRTHVTLDAWMWFFAFGRIEFAFGLLFASIPYLYYSVRQQLRSDGDTEIP